VYEIEHEWEYGDTGSPASMTCRRSGGEITNELIDYRAQSRGVWGKTDRFQIEVCSYPGKEEEYNKRKGEYHMGWYDFSELGNWCERAAHG